MDLGALCPDPCRITRPPAFCRDRTGILRDRTGILKVIPLTSIRPAI